MGEVVNIGGGIKMDSKKYAELCKDDCQTDCCELEFLRWYFNRNFSGSDIELAELKAEFHREKNIMGLK